LSNELPTKSSKFTFVSGFFVILSRYFIHIQNTNSVIFTTFTLYSPIEREIQLKKIGDTIYVVNGGCHPTYATFGNDKESQWVFQILKKID